MIERTLFDKIWSLHAVADLGDGFTLLHVDRHLLHDLSGARGLREVVSRGLRVRNPELTFATPDHTVPSAPGRSGITAIAASVTQGLRKESRERHIRHFDVGTPGHGIVHVIGPELGITLPGVLLVCGDSHTCTHGGMGALSFGIGSTELTHVLATQTLVQRRPRTFRVRFEGALQPGVTPKDLILYLIGHIGAAGGTGFAMEYAGSAIRGLGIEGRLTLCNLSIELGAKVGQVAPDDTAYEFLAGRPFAPQGTAWDRALAYWRTLSTDDGAAFDRELTLDTTQIAPQVTWGTSPEHVIAVDSPVPDPGAARDAGRRRDYETALAYMGLQPGKPLAGTPVDWVFIGSCTNSRLSDLRAAAAVVKGRKAAPTVRAWVVPGSENVKRAAEAEGLHRVFQDAGFEWREPGCSMCVAANGDVIPPGQRCVSTSNRNFVGRQGPGARTHLASPAMAAAAAVTGCITDVRNLER